MIKLSNLLIALVLFSCVSDNEKIAIDQIKSLYQTEDVEITFGFNASTSESSNRYISLEIKNSPIVNSEGYNVDYAGSTSAIALFLQLTDDQFEKYDLVKTFIVTDNNNKKTSFEYSFTLDQLKSVQMSYSFLENFLNKLKLDDFEGASEMFSESFFEEISKVDFINSLSSINSEFGSIRKAELVGFELTEAEFRGKEIPVIQVWGINEHERGNTTTTYLISIEDTNIEIVAIEINSW